MKNYDLTEIYIKEMTYYAGWCGAILKEYGILTGEYYDYL